MAKGKKSAAALAREAKGYVQRVDPVISARNKRNVMVRYGKDVSAESVRRAMREAAERRAIVEAHLLREVLSAHGVQTIGVVETAMQLMPEVLATTVELMLDKGQDPKVRLNAAKTIAEWSCVFGELPPALRPQTRNVDELPPADLDTMIADLKALRDRKAQAEAAAAQALDKALATGASDVPVTLDANPLTD